MAPGHYQRRCMGLYVTLLYYMGVFPGDDQPKTFVFYWRRYLPRVQLIRFIYTIIFNMISTYMVWGSLITMIDFLTCILIYAVALVRYGSLFLHRRLVGRLFATLERLSGPSELSDETLQRKAERTETIATRLLQVSMFGFVGIMAASAISLIRRGLVTRTVPYRLWLPYNYSYPPVFEATLVTINVIGVVDVTMAAFPSFLFVACCIHLIGQYKLLRYKIKNTVKHVDEKMNLQPIKSASVSIDMHDDDNTNAVEYTIIPLKGDDVEDRVEVLTAVPGEASRRVLEVRELTMVQLHPSAEDIQGQSHRNQHGLDMMEEIKELIVTVTEGEEGGPKPNQAASSSSVEPEILGWSKMQQLFKKRQEDEPALETTPMKMEQDLSSMPNEAAPSSSAHSGGQGWIKTRQFFKKRQEDQPALDTTQVKMEQDLSSMPNEAAPSSSAHSGGQGWIKTRQFFKKRQEDQPALDTTQVKMEQDLSSMPNEAALSSSAHSGGQGWIKTRQFFKKRQEDQPALDTTQVKMEQDLSSMPNEAAPSSNVKPGGQGWIKTRQFFKKRQEDQPALEQGIQVKMKMEQDLSSKPNEAATSSSVEPEIVGWSKMQQLFKKCQKDEPVLEQGTQVEMEIEQDLSSTPNEAAKASIDQCGGQVWIKTRQIFKKRQEDEPALEQGTQVEMETEQYLSSTPNEAAKANIDQSGGQGWIKTRQLFEKRQKDEPALEKQAEMEQYVNSKPNEGAKASINQSGGRGWFKTRQRFKKRRLDAPTLKRQAEMEQDLSSKPDEEATVSSAQPGIRGWFKMRQLFKKRREDQQTLVTRTQVEMEQYLKHCAKHHQTILSLTKDLVLVFTSMLRFQTFMNFASGVISLKVTSRAAEYDALLFTSSITVIVPCVEYLLFCWFGNMLTDESEKLREAVYGCEWYGASESFKRSIRIMISRTNQSEVLRAGGLPLSMKSFRFICRTAYYLNNVMVKIIHGVKINDKRR